MKYELRSMQRNAMQTALVKKGKVDQHCQIKRESGPQHCQIDFIEEINSRLRRPQKIPYGFKTYKS